MQQKEEHQSIFALYLLLSTTVIKDSNVVQLDVDSEVNHVVGPLNPKAGDHREPLFVGGVPGNFLEKYTFSYKTRIVYLVFFSHSKWFPINNPAFILLKPTSFSQCNNSLNTEYKTWKFVLNLLSMQQSM